MSSIFFIILIHCAFGLENFQPEQIHISLGVAQNEVVITWVTANKTKQSSVSYGIYSILDQQKEGNATLFEDQGSEHRQIWIHRVHLTNLRPKKIYNYICGSPQGWSDKFQFSSLRDGVDWSPSFAIYGDLGAENPQSLARLQRETEMGLYDAIIHVGDFAYDMDTDNAKVGDTFMKQIEPIAAYVPYMVCPGNHEQKYNFSNYRARFSMPYYKETENLFYSWNMGPAHFVAINTEAYYFIIYGLKIMTKQYSWLEKDLKIATLPDARKKRPWIIIFGHRPMYCSGTDNDDCFYENCVTRVGLPLLGWFGLEKLLYKYGVDLAIWAHEHNYERLWPIYNYEVLNGSFQEPYRNPRGPVHFVTGSAGCKERHTKFFPIKPEWSAFRDVDYGYTRLQILNQTHLYWEQVSDDKNGQVVDSNFLIKTEHKSYALN